MVDLGIKLWGNDLCSRALADTRKVPIDIWVRETKPIIEKMTQWSSENKAIYAAFGATALGALGYSRATKDVDIVIRPGNWTFEQLASELSKEFGLTKCKSNDKVQMLVREIDGFHYVVELWNDYIYVMDCDEQMWSKVQIGQVLGFPFVTLSTEDMISSKLGRFAVQREKEDVTDIAFLLRSPGIKNFDYFLQQIQKIKRNGKGIDEFLYDEMQELSKILGKEETTKLHSNIVRRRPYRQLLNKIMFDLTKESQKSEEIGDKALLDSKLIKELIDKLGIKQTSKGFQIPDKPDATISTILK